MNASMCYRLGANLAVIINYTNHDRVTRDFNRGIGSSREDLKGHGELLELTSVEKPGDNQ